MIIGSSVTKFHKNSKLFNHQNINSNTCNSPKYELTLYQKILIIQGNKDQRNSHTFENELTNRSLGKNKPRIHLLIADEEEIMHKNIT